MTTPVKNTTISFDPETLTPQQREALLPLQQFEYAPSPEETLFAQLVATRQDPVYALTETHPAWCESRTEQQIRRRAATLMTAPRVVERIEYYHKLLSLQLDITAENVLTEAAYVAMADVRGLFDDDGCPVPPNKLPPNVAKAVAHVERIENVKTGVVTWKYRLHNKMDALKWLGTIGGMDKEAREASAPKVAVDVNMFASDPTPSPLPAYTSPQTRPSTVASPSSPTTHIIDVEIDDDDADQNDPLLG